MKVIFGILLLPLVLVTPLTLAQEAIIKFPPRSSPATIKSHVNPLSSKAYRLSVSPNQRVALQLTSTSRRKLVAFTLKRDRYTGKPLAGADAVTVWEGELSDGGDYWISVFALRDAGEEDFTLMISTPADTSAGSSPSSKTWLDPNHPQSAAGIHRATLGEPDQRTKEVSTEELRHILTDKSARVFDTRPIKEYAISHIPGALNVSAKPGVSMSLYVSDVAEIARLLKGDKTAPIVLYCNGPFCGKSKRLASELLEAGYKNVRRYQLGIPIWRALGGVTQVEPAGIRHVIENDRTAVFIDAREADNFKAGSIPGAKSLPRSLVKDGKDVGEVKAAKDDGRLPMEDHNTRIIVFGKTTEEAKAVAEAIAREAFHNVSFFDGSFQQLRSAIQ